jgi:alkylated DNA repair dioxygenase AlkB
MINMLDCQSSLVSPSLAESFELPDADLSLWLALDLGAPADAVLRDLIAQTGWRQDPIKLFGRIHAQPRLVAWHGDPGACYCYAGVRLEPQPWTDLLLRLRARASALAGAAFNSVLLNYYRDGRDSMGLHSDDEPELGPAPVIASLSLGAERRLLFRHRTRRDIPPARIALPCSSLLIMRGPTQRHWKHGIEKSRAGCGQRVNLTFRLIVDTPARGTPARPTKGSSYG